MDVIKTAIFDCWIIKPKVFKDDRGYFYESFHQERFQQLTKTLFSPIQDNEAFSTYGVIRGLHFQEKPNSESKLVRCTKGKVFEVLVDIRPDSSTYRKWVSVILSSENRKMIFVPDGFALGFQTLEDDTELFYQMSQYYEPNSSRGIIWNDPCLKIPWPLNPTIISKKDQTLPLF